MPIRRAICFRIFCQMKVRISLVTMYSGHHIILPRSGIMDDIEYGGDMRRAPT